MLNTKLTVVWDCNYKGNSKTSDKDVLWNNWEMIGYTKLRFGFGLGVSMTHTHTHTHTHSHTHVHVLIICDHNILSLKHDTRICYVMCFHHSQHRSGVCTCTKPHKGRLKKKTCTDDGGSGGYSADDSSVDESRTEESTLYTTRPLAGSAFAVSLSPAKLTTLNS